MRGRLEDLLQVINASQSPSVLNVPMKKLSTVISVTPNNDPFKRSSEVETSVTTEESLTEDDDDNSSLSSTSTSSAMEGRPMVVSFHKDVSDSSIRGSLHSPVGPPEGPTGRLVNTFRPTKGSYTVGPLRGPPGRLVNTKWGKLPPNTKRTSAKVVKFIAGTSVPSRAVAPRRVQRSHWTAPLRNNISSVLMH